MIGDDLTILASQTICPKLRLIMVDYDGTLVPIRATPELAVPTKGLLKTLSALSKLSHPKLAIISGRSIQNLRSMLPMTGICMAGSHGSEILDGKDSKPVALVSQSLRDLFLRLRHDIQRAVGNIPGILVETKPYAIAMHYRAAEAKPALIARKRFRNTVLGCREGHLLKISNNKYVTEAIPKGVSKALAVRHLLETYKAVPEEAVYIGDDRTDEDAFCYLYPSGATVKVARTPCSTAARFRLSDHARVIAFLKHILHHAKLPDHQTRTATQTGT